MGGQQAVDGIDYAIAFGDGQRAAGAKVVLDVHDEQCGTGRRRHLTVHYIVMPTGLSTDLYELTMAAGYFDAGMRGPATFELAVRRLPRDRGYLLAAGIETALAYLEELRLSLPQIEYLRGIPQLRRAPAGFFDD